MDEDNSEEEAAPLTEVAPFESPVQAGIFMLKSFSSAYILEDEQGTSQDGEGERDDEMEPAIVSFQSANNYN